MAAEVESATVEKTLHEQELVRRATVLLRAQRVEKRHLLTHEFRVVSRATAFLSRGFRGGDQTDARLFEAELRQALGSGRLVLPRVSASRSRGVTSRAAPPNHQSPDTEPEQLRVGYAQIGEHCRGVLMRNDERWPGQTPLWMCEHFHPGPTSALACASRELSGRSEEGTTIDVITAA
jgi:hypothetical protein